MANNATQNNSPSNKSSNAMPNPLPTLTKTKTRTKTVVLALAGIAALGTLAWVAAVRQQRFISVCDSGPNAGQMCARNADCERPEATSAQCVKVKVASLPDLAVQSVTFDPTTRVPTLTIVNRGRSSTHPITMLPPPEVLVEWIGSASEIIARFAAGIPALAAGATFTYDTYTEGPFFTPPAEARRVRFTVDRSMEGIGRVVESNENNNVWEGDIPPPPPTPLPDLHNLFERIPDTPTEGAPFTLRVRVQNLGSAEAGTSVSSLQLDRGNDGIFDETLPTRSIPTIVAGATADAVEWSWTAWPSGGPHRLAMCADSGSAVTESDEGNNCSTAVIVTNPAPRPDLAIQSVVFDPVTRLPILIIVNQGTVVAAAVDGRIPQLDAQFLNASGSTVGVGLGTGIRSLAPGETQQYNWSRVRDAAPSDAVRLRINIDDRNNVLESDETNNTWEGDLPLLASSQAQLRFALHPTSPSGASVSGLAEVLRFTASSSVAEGQVRYFSFSIASTDNNGTGTTGGDWNTWQSTTEFIGFSGTDFQLFDSADLATPIAGVWRLYGNEFLLDDDSDTERVLTAAIFTPATPLVLPTGTNRTFALRMDTIGASSSSDDTIRVDLVNAEGIGAYAGIPLYGNLIRY